MANIVREALTYDEIPDAISSGSEAAPSDGNSGGRRSAWGGFASHLFPTACGAVHSQQTIRPIRVQLC